MRSELRGAERSASFVGGKTGSTAVCYATRSLGAVRRPFHCARPERVGLRKQPTRSRTTNRLRSLPAACAAASCPWGARPRRRSPPSAQRGFRPSCSAPSPSSPRASRGPSAASASPEGCRSDRASRSLAAQPWSAAEARSAQARTATEPLGARRTRRSTRGSSSAHVAPRTRLPERNFN